MQPAREIRTASALRVLPVTGGTGLFEQPAAFGNLLQPGLLSERYRINGNEQEENSD